MADSSLLVPAVGTCALAAVIYYFFGRKPVNKDAIPIPLDSQSVILPGPERIRAARYGWKKSPTEMMETYHEDVKTVYDNFLRGLKTSNNGPCLGYRPSSDVGYKWMSYNEVHDAALNLGSAMSHCGISDGSDTYVGIYAGNCPEWSISGLACQAFSRVVVPLYDTLGSEAVAFVLEQATISVVITDTVEKAQKIISILKSGGRDYKVNHIIVMKADAESMTTLGAAALAAGVKVHSYAGMLELGKQNPHSPIPPKPEDIYIICYTSGTTGFPKGVMLSHKALIAEASAMEYFMHKLGKFPFETTDRSISYLPLAHMFEQLHQVMLFSFGAQIGFAQGDIRKLTDDLKQLKPSFMPVVPRVLQRLSDQVQGKLLHSGPVARFMFKMAYASKYDAMRRGIYTRDTIWDKLIFNKIAKELGGNVRIMVTGSAPIAKEVLNTCRVALGCQIYEGYGQTECAAACTVTMPGDLEGGCVGPPIPSCHVKLVDVPELNYLSKDDKGEVCIRGPIVMDGYYKQPEKTAETIDKAGWLHTGDVGMWLPNGTLKIIDRVKHIMKLAQGEYVAPEKIEAIYIRLPLVTQVFVDGSSLERYLVSVVVPDKSELLSLAEELGIFSTDPDDLCTNRKVRAAVVGQMQALGKQNKLQSIEQAKSVFLTMQPFSIENDLLTPTMKNKRPQLRRHFADQMRDMYKELNNN